MSENVTLWQHVPLFFDFKHITLGLFTNEMLFNRIDDRWNTLRSQFGESISPLYTTKIERVTGHWRAVAEIPVSSILYLIRLDRLNIFIEDEPLFAEKLQVTRAQSPPDPPYPLRWHEPRKWWTAPKRITELRLRRV